MKRFDIRAVSSLAALMVFAASADAYAYELIQNGGFESPYLGPYGWTNPGLTTPVPGAYDYIVYPYPTLDGWTYSLHAGLINAEAGSDTYGPVPPPGFGGDQFAAVQLTGSLSQYFVSPGGELRLSWLEGGRPNLYGTNGGNETYAVEVDGATVGTFSTVDGQSFTPETLTLTDISTGLHDLAFRGLTSAGDETSFLDNVSILTGPVTSIPEPATWLLTIAGFGALAAMTGLRRKQPREGL
jgi:PEP-CTERM motif